jgi:hypothetical protein
VIGKLLALAGFGVGAFVVVDKVMTGTWVWETTVPTRQQIQTKNLIRRQVNAELANQERERLAKEKQALMQGRYAQASYWTQQPSATNYGLSHY